MNSAWQDNFKSSALRVGFKMSLTRAMCEFISAIADGVHWNRTALGAASADPDNFIATSRALVLRGIIERKPDAEIEAERNESRNHFWSWTHWRLTPAGEHVVQLLKLADMFIEQDMAEVRRLRKAKREAPHV